MVTRCGTLGPGEFVEALAVALERGGGAVPPFGVEERIGTLTDPLEEIFGGLVGRPGDGVGERAVAPGCELALDDGGLGEVYPVGCERPPRAPHGRATTRRNTSPDPGFLASITTL